MIGHDIQFHAPDTLDDALSLLAAASNAAVIGGGTMLVPDMTLARVQPDAVIDIRRLGLSGVAVQGASVVIGAATSYRELSAAVQTTPGLALLGLMASQITGGPQIRNQATIGGAACYANPSSDGPACLTVLDARFQLASTSGVREVPAQEFFVGAFRTARRKDELLVRIIIPRLPDGTRVGYDKLKICESSWPIVTASCLLIPQSARDTVCARIAIGAASPAPVVLADAALEVSAVDPVSLGQSAASLIGEEWADELAGPGYRRQVAPIIARRAIQMAMQGAIRT